MKRILSLILVTVMLFSLAPMAFAEDPIEYSYQYVLPGKSPETGITFKTNIKEADLPVAYENDTAQLRIAGWYNDPVFENATDFSGAGVDVTNNDVILYAKGSNMECYVITYFGIDDVPFICFKTGENSYNKSTEINAGIYNPNPRTYDKEDSLTLQPAVWLEQDSIGWLEEAEGELKPVEGPISGRNATVSPLFDVVTVSFDCAGKCVDPVVQILPKNAKLTEPSPAPSAEGFKFDGWCIDNATTTKWDFNDNVTDSMTLYAKWVEQVTVAFDTEYGEKPDSVTVDKGSKISEPAPLTEKGYTFDGWYKDTPDKKWNFSTDTVESNMILHADWIPYKYTIRYNLNGGTGTRPANDNVSTGTTLTFPDTDAKKGNLAFKGWARTVSVKDNETIYPAGSTYTIPTDFATPGSTVIFYAIWSDKVVVKFNTDGGSTIDDQTLNVNDKVTKPTNPTKENFRFGGWYKDSKCTTAWDFEKDIVTRDTTLYAKWLAKHKVTVTVTTGTSYGSASYKKNSAEPVKVSPSATDNEVYGTDTFVVTAAANQNYYAKIYTDQKTLKAGGKGETITYTLTKEDIESDVTIKVLFSNNPITGDEFNPILWVLALSAGAAGAAVTLIAKKKRTQH